MLPTSMVGKPTVAAILKTTQNFFQSLEAAFDFEIQWADRLDLSTLGMVPPQRGISLRLGSCTVKTMGKQLAAFTSRRPVRSAGDLSRPV